jgi:hypothetical protein
MLLFRAGLHLLPFRTLCRWLKRMEAAGGPPFSREGDQVAAIARSILRANKLLGWRDDCLPQALTARLLMKRQGLAANLRIGVKKGSDGQLRAHAWVEHNGDIVVGGTGPNLHSYTPLTALTGLDRVIL